MWELVDGSKVHPSLSTTVRALRFDREKSLTVPYLVDSRRILDTHAAICCTVVPALSARHTLQKRPLE